VLFEKSMMQGVLNFNRDVIPDYTDRPVGMIILTDTAFRKQITPFVRWKTQKGFRVTVLYKGAGMAGTTVSQIKESLARIYNTATEDGPAPDYLLIVGDINHVPCFGTGTTSNYTDMYYGEFTGNGDYVPEMYVGRLPAKDTAEVRSTLNKIIQYEKFQFASTNKFYRNALATVGYDGNNAVFMNGQTRYLVTNYLTASNNVSEKHFYHYSGADPDIYLQHQKDSIFNLLNGGLSFINYSGHGDEYGWLQLNIKTADTASMQNENMYPVMISNACRTATFNLENSFGNRLVLEKNRGAAGFIGCSNDSYWNEDYYWTVGVANITEYPSYSGKGLGSFDRLFHSHNEYPSDWYYTLGQINYSGNLSVSASTSLRKKYYWETYNVIGDPSMIPLIGEPKTFNLNIPDTLPNGIKSLTLTVDPFAYVAVSHFDTLWDASFGSVSGAVNLEMPGLSNDSCLVVVTGQNRFPIIKTVYFSKVTEEFLNLNKTEINDPQGNNNKKADFSEKIYLSVALSNLGLTDATGVYAKISSASEWFTIQNDSAFIGTLKSGTNTIVSDKFLIDISENIPDMGIATIDLLIKSNNSEKLYPVDLIVHSPKLLITNLIIDDTGTGNGDHIADPGETINLIFRVKNEGSSDATGQFNINSPSNGITLIESGVTGKVFKYGQSTDIILKAELSGTLSSGSYLSVASNLIADPFILNKNFTFRLGKIRESFEASSFNIFPWINVSPVPWTINSGNFFDGAISARSGTISHNGTSSLIIKTWYPAPDTLKFLCKISSEPSYDYFAFILNGNQIVKKSGEVDWTKVAVPVDKGLNKLEWIYKKDNSVSGGYDCAWIDMIDFAGTGSVSYIRKDINVARIVTPLDKNHLGQALIKVKLLNAGRDTIKKFNLAFSVDNKPAIRQTFDATLLPGTDSVEVIFKTRADLSKFGYYKLSVFGFNNLDDFPGNDTTSIEIENTIITESLILYPNPVVNDLTLFINSKSPDRIRITISNVAGSAVYITERDIATGGNSIPVSGVPLVPATYYVNIKGALIDKTVPFIKIK
jgi:hypothetical protein